METKKLDTETRQRQILEEVLGIVSKDGLEGLRVASLANRSGLVPSGVYRHFQGKIEIVEAVLGMVNERLIGNVEAVCAETAGAEERLHRLIIRHVKLLLENPGIPQVVFSEGVFSSTSAANSRVRRIIQGFLARVEEIIRKGQEDGQIDPEIEPEMVSVMFPGLILPVVILSTVTFGEFDTPGHVGRAWLPFASILRKRS